MHGIRSAPATSLTMFYKSARLDIRHRDKCALAILIFSSKSKALLVKHLQAQARKATPVCHSSGRGVDIPSRRGSLSAGRVNTKTPATVVTGYDLHRNDRSAKRSRVLDEKRLTEVEDCERVGLLPEKEQGPANSSRSQQRTASATPPRRVAVGVRTTHGFEFNSQS